MAQGESPGPFDAALLARRIGALSLRGARAMPDFLHRRAAEELAARAGEAGRFFERAMIRAVAPAEAAGILRAGARVGDVRHVSPWAAPEGSPAERAVDPERPGLEEESLDLFVSICDLAFVNDLPGALLAIRRALKPGGMFLACLPGGESLRELRAAWALADAARYGEPGLRVAPFCDLKQLGGLLQLAGFAEPVSDMERLVLRHDSALSLMYELKAMGWSNCLRGRPRAPVTRGLLAHAAAAFEAACGDADGRVSSTFELLYLTGRAVADGAEGAAACAP